MIDLFTSIAQVHGFNESVGFASVMFSGAILMPMVYMLLSGVFTGKDEWVTPQEAYTPRCRRELI